MRCARIVPKKWYGPVARFFARAYDTWIDCSDITPLPRNIVEQAQAYAGATRS